MARSAFLAFLEQIIVLPTELEDQLLAELASEEGIEVAQVMSRYERQGFQKGRQEERMELALRLLARKCGALDDATIARVRALADDRLLALYDAAIDFTGRADLDRWLAAEVAAQPRE